ncbi:hypothetical protein [Modestobacter sp. SYSU DS0290]
MRLKNTLVALLIAGTTVLTGCGGDNIDVNRGETDCDAGSGNTHDENCETTGTPDPPITSEEP